MNTHWEAWEVKTERKLSEISKHDRDFILQQTLNGMLISGALNTKEYNMFSKDLTKFYNQFK